MSIESSSGAASPGWTGAMGMPTRLILMRHGQTEMSIERRYSGRGNPPLTPLGREQAVRAAERLAGEPLAAVITSPLKRARDTADLIAERHGLIPQSIDGFIETDFGEWEGLTFREASDRDPDIHRQWCSDAAVAAPGGESFAEVGARVLVARDALIDRYPAATIVIVSHVTPIKIMLQSALDVGPQLLYRLHLDLASRSIAEHYPDGGTSVRLVNATD